MGRKERPLGSLNPRGRCAGRSHPRERMRLDSSMGPRSENRGYAPCPGQNQTRNAPPCHRRAFPSALRVGYPLQPKSQGYFFQKSSTFFNPLRRKRLIVPREPFALPQPERTIACASMRSLVLCMVRSMLGRTIKLK